MTRALFTAGTVEIKGLDNLINWLGQVDPKLMRAFKKGLKESVEGAVLVKARANASKIADDGTFSSSISVAAKRGGVEYELKSTDVAAGVKEFARPGAVGLRGRWRGKRVGVPHRANRPRAMVPAVDDSAAEVRDAIETRMAEVLNEVPNG